MTRKPKPKTKPATAQDCIDLLTAIHEPWPEWCVEKEIHWHNDDSVTVVYVIGSGLFPWTA